ncbi:hypothetical protein J4733_18795 [Klebsiella pneumoniae]|uniref:Uncharacterized protein n=1 Tax=Klebsiella pneumoniae TaxID=573 RepID=A0A939NR84_KLEPN|nr:hypothetical protein [Klebsiella pneumoniae]
MLWHQYCHPVKGAGAATPYYERLMSALRGHMEAAAKMGITDVQVCGMLFLQWRE